MLNRRFALVCAAVTVVALSLWYWSNRSAQVIVTTNPKAIKTVLTRAASQQQGPVCPCLHPGVQHARPKFLFLTAPSRSTVPQYVWERFRRFSNGYQILFYDDEQCEQSLCAFGPTVTEKFQNLHGAHRADLWRYCMLYLYGGVYTDIKTVFTRQLDDVAPDPYQSYSVISMTDYSIHQAFLSLPPRSPVMMECILDMLTRPYPVSDYLAFCKFLFKVLTHHLGRVKVGTTNDWTLYKEVMSTDNCETNDRDRYGYCPIDIVNERGEIMMKSRDPAYPWK